MYVSSYLETSKKFANSIDFIEMSIKLVVTWLLVVGVAIRADTTAKIEDDDDDTKNKPSYVVTDEAWFEVEIRDLEGPGMHYRGRFEVGLFGEIVPMTTMNFVGICKGYKSGKVCRHYPHNSFCSI